MGTTSDKNVLQLADYWKMIDDLKKYLELRLFE